jgi:hypothetical protein
MVYFVNFLMVFLWLSHSLFIYVLIFKPGRVCLKGEGMILTFILVLINWCEIRGDHLMMRVMSFNEKSIITYS